MDLLNISTYQEAETTLQKQWDSVTQHRTLHITLIQGESGMRKTELLHRFLHRHNLPHLFCRAAHIPEAYLPLRHLFDSILQLSVVKEQLALTPEQVMAPWRNTLTTLASAIPLLQPLHNLAWQRLAPWQPALHRRYPSGASEDATEEDALPPNLPELLALVLGDIAAVTPIALFIDNLDNADTSTIEALAPRLLRPLRDAPVLFLAAIQEEAPLRAPLLNVIPTLTPHQTQPSLITIPPITVELVQAHVRERFPSLDEETNGRISQMIHLATGGSLAQVTDMLALLARRGEAQMPQLEALPSREMVMEERFLALVPDEQRFLQVAAVQGRYFCLPVAAQVSGLTDSDSASLMALAAHQPDSWIRFLANTQVGEQSLPWYRFRRRNQEWLYESLRDETERRDLQRRTAEFFEDLYQEQTPAIAALLATLFEQGHAPAKAAHYTAELAHRANVQREFRQGYDLAVRGLEHLKHAPPSANLESLRCRLLSEKGIGLQSTEQSHTATEVLQEAYELAQRLNDPALIVRTGYQLGKSLIDLYAWEKSQHILREVLTIAVALDEWGVVVEGMESLRNAYYKQGQATVFFTLCDDLIMTLREPEHHSLSAQLAIVEILEDKGWTYFQLQKRDSVRETLEEALSILDSLSTSHQCSELYYKIYRWLSGNANELAEQEKAFQYAERCVRWADRSNMRHCQVLARIMLTRALRYMGKISEAEGLLKETHQIIVESSDLATLAELENEMGVFYSRLGRKKYAREFYQRSYQHRMMANRILQAQASLSNLGEVEVTLGNFENSLALHRQLYNDGVAQDDKARQSLSLNLIGNVERILNHIGEALEIHNQVIALCQETGLTGRKALALRRIGQCYLAQGDITQAKLALSQAHTIYKEKSANLSLLYPITLIYLGRLGLYENNFAQSQNYIADAIHQFSQFKDLLWIGVALLNQSLLSLSMGQPAEALSQAQAAHEALVPTESWRVSEAHHLLARCYLGMGEFEEALQHVTEAKRLFTHYQLFHCFYQAENTELRIERAMAGKENKPFHLLTLDELMSDFNLLGN